MRKTLYIIGNGFDLHHGFNLQYENYRKYLENYHFDDLTKFEHFLKSVIQFDDAAGLFWSNIEDGITKYHRKFIWNLLHKQNKGMSSDLLIEKLVEEREIITRILRIYFYEWILKGNKTQICKENMLDFCADSDYISFNYTDILEKAYGIDRMRVFHIHGSLEQFDFGLSNKFHKVLKEKEQIELVDSSLIKSALEFGCIENLTIDALEKFVPELQQFVAESMEQIEKKTGKCAQELIRFLDGKQYDDIYILGHSCWGIDEVYYKNILFPKFPVARWFVSYFKDNEKTKIRELFSQVSPNLEYKFCQIKDLMRLH